MTHSDPVWSQVKTSLIKHKMKNKSLLLAVSGGVDSICLLTLLNKLKDNFLLNLRVIYVHHGSHGNAQQVAYRNKCTEFLKKLTDQMELKLVVVKSNQKLKTETEFRDYRYRAIHQKKKPKEFIVLAHHREDLLESRLIRLIRGVGEQGLEAMGELEENLFRPFLKCSRRDLETYAQKNKLKFINDPSNRDNKILRNWIRNQWLPQLEAFRPGATKTLDRSLELLVHEKSTFNPARLVSEEGISRSKLLELPRLDQRRVVAHYLKNLRVKNYSASGIDEVIKRVDSPKKELTFKTMGCNWTVDTWHIRVRTS